MMGAGAAKENSFWQTRLTSQGRQRAGARFELIVAGKKGIKTRA
jgi:hypothetical protein